MRAVFAIKAWAAVAPGLQNQAQWLQWAQAPACPVGVAEVDLAHVPPMSRRRLGLLAKMAVVLPKALACPESSPCRTFLATWSCSSKSLHVKARPERS